MHKYNFPRLLFASTALSVHQLWIEMCFVCFPVFTPSTRSPLLCLLHVAISDEKHEFFFFFREIASFRHNQRRHRNSSSKSSAAGRCKFAMLFCSRFFPPNFALSFISFHFISCARRESRDFWAFVSFRRSHFISRERISRAWAFFLATEQNSTRAKAKNEWIFVAAVVVAARLHQIWTMQCTYSLWFHILFFSFCFAKMRKMCVCVCVCVCVRAREGNANICCNRVQNERRKMKKRKTPSKELLPVCLRWKLPNLLRLEMYNVLFRRGLFLSSHIAFSSTPFSSLHFSFSFCRTFPLFSDEHRRKSIFVVHFLLRRSDILASEKILSAWKNDCLREAKRARVQIISLGRRMTLPLSFAFHLFPLFSRTFLAWFFRFYFSISREKKTEENCFSVKFTN